jgi:hypothetical protein
MTRISRFLVIAETRCPAALFFLRCFFSHLPCFCFFFLRRSVTRYLETRSSLKQVQFQAVERSVTPATQGALVRQKRVHSRILVMKISTVIYDEAGPMC